MPQTSTLTLIASLLALAAGPLVAYLTGTRLKLWQLLDGFVLTVIAVLIVGHVLPEAVQTAGMIAIPVAIAGLALAPQLEKGLVGLSRAGAVGFTLIGSTLVLATHSVMDGIAIRQSDHNAFLGLAVVLHQIPKAVAIWWLAKPALGKKQAIFLLSALGLATIIGFFSSSETIVSDTPMAAIVRALVAGGLLHVVLAHARHGHEHSCEHDGDHIHEHGESWHTGLGALLGLISMALLMVFVPEEHPHDHGTGYSTFLHLALQTAPAMLIGFAAGGALHALLPNVPSAWMTRGGASLQALKGMLFGLPLPLCSCGVLPTYRTLVICGTPAAAAMAFLIATPEIGIDAFTLSVPLLGWPVTIARLLAAAAIAFFVGVLVGGRTQSIATTPEPSCCHAKETPKTISRWRLAFKTATTDMVDHTAPWVIAGLVLATLAEPLLQLGWMKFIPSWAEVPMFALIGIPVYVCAVGATPLVAVFIAEGISPGAAIAFLLTGPATNISTFGVLQQLHGRKTAIFFGSAVGIGATVIGYAINIIFENVSHAVPPHGHHEHVSIGAWISLGVFAMLVAWSIVRQGPRTFLGQVLEMEK